MRHDLLVSFISGKICEFLLPMGSIIVSLNMLFDRHSTDMINSIRHIRMTRIWFVCYVNVRHFLSALLVYVGAKLCFSVNFILSCQAQNETFEDIYFLKLSKNASTTLSDIVFIKPDIPVSKPTDYTEEWQSANVRSRSSTDKSSVFPVNATRLVLTITKETDEGVYVCWIKGRTVRGPVDEKYFIYKRVSGSVFFSMLFQVV